jgi:putative membrane protein
MMRNRLPRPITFPLVLVFVAAVSNAQTPPSEQHMDHGARKMMKSPEIAFAIRAAQGGLAEIKLGRLAAEKGSAADVKAFGQQMVDDHGKANQQLKAAAESEGMTLPSDVNGKQQVMYDRLSKLSGAQFDAAYVKDMLMDHEEDVKDFKKESESGRDEKFRSFASQTLPVIQGHLDKLRAMEPQVSSSSK